MALPNSLSSSTPAGSDSPSQGDDVIRAKSLAILDILGIPDATTITQAAFDIDAGGLAQAIFYDAATEPASGELGRTGSVLKWRIEDSRTATTIRPLAVAATTSGTPAASIGVGLLLQAESGDEVPSDFAGLDTIATDVTAGSEDTDLLVMLRAGGAALAEKFRVKSTGTLALIDVAADPASGELGRTTSTLKWRIEDSRTATVLRALGITATTSGTPAAGIGTGLLFQAESGDEVPSDFGALDFVASDVGAGTEDTYATLALRVAGAALNEKYRFSSTATSSFAALLTHALSANRTFTLPDVAGTFDLIDAAQTVSAVKTFTAAPIVAVEDSRTATTLRPFTVRATTSGTPSASIGVGILFDAESGDEAPSNFGALDFVATDVTAGSEDTYASLLLRVAGRDLDEKYRFGSTAGSGFTAVLAHAVTADRIFTLPDAAGTFDLIDAAQTVSGVKTFTAAPVIAVEDSRTATTLRPLTVRATTSGSPATSLGVGVLFDAESGDETPSNFGAVDFVATDVSAGSEDTVLDIMLRTAGAALGTRYRFASTGAFMYTFTGAPSADRTLTLPNAAGTVALTSDITAGGLTYRGSNSTEATTAAGSSVDLVTVTGLSITAATPFVIKGSMRKSAGAAAAPLLRLKLNSTVVASGEAVFSATDQAESGAFEIYVGPRVTGYLRGMRGAAASNALAAPVNLRCDTDMPTATITDVVIGGSSVNASVTLGIDEVFVYTLAVS